MPVITRKGSDLRASFVGETEKEIREVFQLAHDKAGEREHNDPTDRAGRESDGGLGGVCFLLIEDLVRGALTYGKPWLHHCP